MPQGRTCKDQETGQQEDSLKSIKYSLKGTKNYKKPCSQTPELYMLSLVDLSGRASVQESLLPIQVEEATTSTTVRVAQNTTTTNTSATQEASTAKDRGHSHRQA